MHFCDIPSWLADLETATTPLKRKRTLSRSPRPNCGLSSPPSSFMDPTDRSRDRGDDDVDNITPRPPRFTSPSKRQRTSADAPPRNSPSHGSARSTRSYMTGSNTGSDSRSAGSRNGIKDMADLAVALKPITCVKPSSQADIPADIQNLARRLKEVQGGRGVIPRDVFTKVQSSLGVIEPSLSDENVYDTDALRRTIRDDGQPTSWSAWDVDDEYNVLRRVAARTEECDIENVSEPSWNARVHEPLLDMALSTFRGSLSHWDVTRAIITRDYHLRRDAGPLKSKMVDFVITLDSTSVVAAAKDQIRLQGGSPRSINHTEYQPLRYRPIAISIETKPTNGSIDEGMTQLAVWSSAYMSRLKELSTTSDKAAAGVGIGVTLPLLLVRGSQWSLMMAVDQVREMKLLDFGVIGNTSTLVGCYKMVAQLRCFAEWSTTTFQEWILREALS